MLKGTTKIELTDVHTGAKETVTEENMVTGALKEIFRPIGHLKTPATMYQLLAPYYQTLLGGLLLFDGNIEESEDTYFAPADVNMVGCAVYNVQNNTTGTARGGYNQTESEINLTTRYMKYVYDFTTSQANGTISCICLTHASGGYNGYGYVDAVPGTVSELGFTTCTSTLHYVYQDYTGATTTDKTQNVTFGTSEALFMISRSEDAAYYFKIVDESNISIIKRRAHLKSVSVLVNPYTTKELIEEAALDSLSTELPTYYTAYNYDHTDKCLYLVSSSSSTIAANGTFVVTKIDTTDWSIKQYTMTNTADVSLSGSGSQYAIVHQGYVYMRSYSGSYKIYKLELGNSANVTVMDSNGITSISGLPLLAHDGRIYYITSSGSSSNRRVYILNTQTEQFTVSENYGFYSDSGSYSYTPVVDEPMLYYKSSGGSNSTGLFVTPTNYLATINNLSEAVTKTADKTMKITYTIQEQ